MSSSTSAKPAEPKPEVKPAEVPTLSALEEDDEFEEFAAEGNRHHLHPFLLRSPHDVNGETRGGGTSPVLFITPFGIRSIGLEGKAAGLGFHLGSEKKKNHGYHDSPFFLSFFISFFLMSSSSG